MATDSTKRDIPVYETDEFDLDGYEVVRGEFFAHLYEPSFTFNNNKIALNTACIRKLPDTEYVQILVNQTKKKLAVRPCQESDKDSFRWCTAGKGRRSPKQVTCRIFFAKIVSMMGWNPHYRYKLIGKMIKAGNELLFFFDLNTPEIFVRTVKDNGKVQTSRTPSYPEEWKNQFGVPVKEHQESLQINIFDGYTVFDITGKKGATAESEVETNEEHDSITTKPMYRPEEEPNTNTSPYSSNTGQSELYPTSS